MKYLIFLGLSLISVSALGQFDEPLLSDWQILSQQIHGLHGLGLFGIAFLIVQGLFLIFRTAIGKVLGAYKLIVLAVLSVVVTIGVKLLSGELLLTVLTDGPTLLAFQVLMNQIYQQWEKFHMSDPQKVVASKYKMGRKARTFDPRVKRLKSWFKTASLPAPPPKADWTNGVKDFGMMLNDQLSDCTCAAVYHARQIWTMQTGKEITEPDANVLKLYENSCGYDPNDPNSDQGGIEQDVLKYLLNSGIPLSDGSTDKILGYVEVDQTMIDEVKLTVSEFGVAYIGIEVPKNIFGKNGQPLQTWDYVSGSKTDGGHAIVIVGYDDSGFTVISWGSLYKMTYAFFAKYCVEVYAIVDKNWIAKTGKTPLGLSLADLETLMKELAE